MLPIQQISRQTFSAQQQMRSTTPPLCFCVCAIAGNNSFIAQIRNMYSRLQNETPNDETSSDGSKTETSNISAAPIPDSYGSTPVQDKTVHRFYVPGCGLVFYVMAFIGRFCAMSLRETLSVAIVAMVNQTVTLTEVDIAMTNASDQGECPTDPEVEHEGGEFNWDRNQEAIVLGAFYYGFAVTQVCSIYTVSVITRFVLVVR